jgi:hypothetical protein
MNSTFPFYYIAQHGHRHCYARQSVFRDFATKVRPLQRHVLTVLESACTRKITVANSLPHTTELNLYVLLRLENLFHILTHLDLSIHLVLIIQLL